MKLPMLQLVTEAYGDLLTRPMMFLLIAAIVLPVALFLPEALLHWEVPLSWFWDAICLLPFVVFALVWLRLKPVTLQAERRQQRAPSEGLVAYLAAGAVLLVLLWLPFISYPLVIALFLELGRAGQLQDVSGWSNEVVAAVALVPAWSYLLMRVSLVLPAAAQGKPIDLRAAWYATTGNGWRLMAASLLTTFPMLFLAIALPNEISSQSFYFKTALGRLAVRLVVGPLELAAAALFMNVLTGAYRQLPGNSSGHEQTLMRFE